MSFFRESGLAFVAWLQSIDPALDSVMEALSLLVRAEVMLVFTLPLTYWLGARRVFGVAFAFVAFDIALGDILKILLAEPRPWWVADLRPLDRVTSLYSSPAGYASFSVVFWGFVAWRCRSRTIAIVGAVVTGLACLAKIYQAAALPDHVVLGLVQGAAILLLARWLVERHGQMLAGLDPLRAVGLLGAVVASYYILALGIYALHHGYRIPLEYIEYKVVASDRMASGGGTFAISLMAGLVVGLLKARDNGLLASPTWPRRIATSVLGLIGCIVLVPLGVAKIEDWIHHRGIVWAVNSALMFAMGYWITWGAPCLGTRRAVRAAPAA